MAGLLGLIIDAPNQVMDDAIASATHMLGFNERQGVRLAADLKVDGGVIPAGTIVSSHMILLNMPDGHPAAYAVNDWVFADPVTGVMSDINGELEAESSPLLGAPPTLYPRAFRLRGIEDRDGYAGVGTTTLRVTFHVWQPGDWIRVITGLAPVAARPTK